MNVLVLSSFKTMISIFVLLSHMKTKTSSVSSNAHTEKMRRLLHNLCPLVITTLKVTAHEQDYNFYFSTDGQWQPLAENVDGRILSTPVAGGFVGAYIAMVRQQ
jgi:beta-xylosidase